MSGRQTGFDDFGAGEDILFERLGALALVTLNRPRAMNALTHEMALALEAALEQWRGDDAVACVAIRGAGERAFCAGGDIRRLYDEGRAGGDYPYNFYRDEYRLDSAIFHYPKPYIALMDGIVMGGGVGISVHGSHRVVGDRTLFAMPETGIGLFPDVGGAYFLPRLPGQTGLYLALTGARMGAADALLGGVGDAYVPSGELDRLIAALAAMDANGDAFERASEIIRGHAGEAGEAPLTAVRDGVDRHFALGGVEDIISSLNKDGSDWALKLAESIDAKSPTSLRIAYRQIRNGARMDFNRCMAMEYRIACGCIGAYDFYEGTRAAVIDKDQAPRWRPASLAELPEADIDAYFERPARGGDLDLPDPPAGFVRRRMSGDIVAG